MFGKKYLRMTCLFATVLALIACGVFSTPNPTPEPAQPTVTLTATLAVTPTQSHPSFSKEEILEIPSISAVVGNGTVVFAEGEETGKLSVKIDGTTPIVEGYWCLCCMKTIRVEPNLRIPTNPFFINTEAPAALGGFISESMVMDNLVLSSPIPDDATEFIVSGPEGATLRKEGKGFLLVEGSAYFLETVLP